MSDPTWNPSFPEGSHSLSPFPVTDHLVLLSNEMCQMNTRIRRIAHHQSRLSGFVPSPSPDPSEESSDGGDDESDDASLFAQDDKMTDSQ